MIVNVCTGGNTIHITDSAQGYRVSAIEQKSFSDMAFKRVDLSKSIFSILNEMERNIGEGA